MSGAPAASSISKSRLVVAVGVLQRLRREAHVLARDLARLALEPGRVARSARQFVSSRQRMPGSQAMPPSRRSTLSAGSRSKTPWQISETRWAMMLPADPSVCHSM